jgi:Cu-Zn family superoxide dismutase
MQKRSLKFAIVGVSSLLAMFGCGGSQQHADAPAPPEPEASAESAAVDAEGTEATGLTPLADTATHKTVEVTFQAKSGSKVTGTGSLTEIPEGVQVTLVVEDVSPPGDHGAHVHEKGDCSSPDGESAGGHFNPSAQPHALPVNSPRHLGDFGNIVIGADGKGTLEIVAPGANLKEGDPSSFLGRAIIIHAKRDDGGQPTGNAGGRIACAEIK